MSRRINKKRKLNKRILFLCEGQTELSYMYFIKSKMSRNKQRGIDIEIIHKPKNDPISLYRTAYKKKTEANKIRTPYEKIWIIFDHDNHPNRKVLFEKTKDDNKIEIIFNSICFEIWLNYHFENKYKVFDNCNDAKRYLKQQHISNYSSGHNDWNSILSDDMIEKAKENAKINQNKQEIEVQKGTNIWDLNPYTNMDEVIEFLFNL